MRVFVGFAVPDAVRERLEAAIAPLRDRYDGCNWPPPATWHVTLAFVGEIPDERCDEVVDAVERAVDTRRSGAVSLRLAGPGRFGPRVAWLGVQDDPRGAVAELGAEIQAEVAAVGLPVDAKEVRPHVTMVRARGGKGRLPAGLVEDLPRLDLAWDVEAATVYRSHLGRGPLEYEVLAEVPLAGPASDG